MSLGDLADRTGMSRQYLNLLELGRHWPNLVRLRKIARALGVTDAEMFELLAASSDWRANHEAAAA